MANRPSRPLRIGLACSETMRRRCDDPAVQARLDALGDASFAAFSEPSSWTDEPPYNAVAEERLIGFARGLDALVIGPGAPRITAAVLDAVPALRFIGELEGDRFARRIDVTAAAARGVKVVDTTHGSSYPVAEWALALMLIGLRNAGELFRRLAAGEVIDKEWKRIQPGYRLGELSGRRVGLIGCGHIGRRLLELLRPFAVDVLVHDPHVPRVIADIYDLTLTGLDTVMAGSDVVVCLAPLTAETAGMIGAAELDRLRPDTVFVNVGRGAVVDSAALVRRLARGDVIGCIDVFDPEPIPADSPLRGMPNVFLSPHIAGVTARCGPRFLDLMLDEIERHFAGHETRHDLTPRL